ncbi:MAG TPA: DUF6458 family protein [Streptosporangiaceae bacterium]
MGVGVSVFLLILGAILRFAIKADLVGKSVDIHVIGVILMIAGAGTFLLTIIMTSRSAGREPQRGERLYNGDNPPPV